MKYFTYDIKKYNFRQLLCEVLENSDLENLHKLVDYPELFTMKTEQSTIFHKLFYSKVRDSKFIEIYNQFIKEIVKPYFGEDKIVYQKIPSFRTQFVNNLSVGKWHRDRDYSHSIKEVNWFLPMTDAINTNAVWVESKDGKGDYKPFNAKYGEFVIWNGVNLRHGNKKNEENFTRVSFDLRAMKYSDYKESEFEQKQSVHAGTKMVIGEYFEEI